MTELDLKQRQFPVAFAKKYASRIYGKIPASHTWSNWRSWAGVSEYASAVNFDQLCFLAAVATIRSYHRRRELTRQEVNALACTVAIQEPLTNLIRYLDATGFVAGSDAIDALRARGVSTSFANLYRKVPRFSKQNVYKVSYLESLIA